MNCKIFRRQLNDYMNGVLPPSKCAALDAHADGCPDCAKFRDELLTVTNRLRTEFVTDPAASRDASQHEKYNARQVKGHPGGNTIRPGRATPINRAAWILSGILLLALIAVSVYASGLQGLLELMRDKNPEVRSAAVAELGRNIWQKDVVDAITNALMDESPEVRASVANTVGEIIQQSIQSGFTVTDMLLKDNDPEVRKSAIQALLHLAPLPDIMGPKLTKQLDDDDAGVRAQAVDMLGNVGGYHWHEALWGRKIIYAVIDTLQDTDPEVRRMAVEALGNVGPDPIVVDALIAILDDPEVGSTAAHNFARFKGRLPQDLEDKVIDALIKALDNKEVRTRAAFALGNFGPDAKDAVPKLAKILGELEGMGRANLINSLGKIGPAAKQAVPALINALGDEFHFVRDNAISALAQIDPKPELVPYFIDALNAKEWGIQNSAAYGLGVIGPAANSAIPLLVKLFDDYHTRENAIYALSEIAVKPADIDTIINSLSDPNWMVREAAAKTLGIIGPSAKNSVGALVQALKDADYRVRGAAASALGGIGPAAKDAIPALLEILNAGDNKQVYLAIEPLGKIGTAAKDAVPVLIKILKDESIDAYIRASAAKALGGIGPEPGVADALKDAMHDGEQQVREAAITALGDVGTEPGVEDALLEVLASDDYSLKHLACEALSKTHPSPRAVDALIDALNIDSFYLQMNAAIAIGNAGEYGAKAIPVLNRMVELQKIQKGEGILIAPDRSIAAADYALFMQGVDKAQHLNRLISALHSDDSECRVIAAQCLSYIGPDASPALADLKTIAKTDPSCRPEQGFTVRHAARQAIAAIETR